MTARMGDAIFTAMSQEEQDLLFLGVVVNEPSGEPLPFRQPGELMCWYALLMAIGEEATQEWVEEPTTEWFWLPDWLQHAGAEILPKACDGFIVAINRLAGLSEAAEQKRERLLTYMNCPVAAGDSEPTTRGDWEPILSRTAVYELIDGERAYQDQRWDAGGARHSYEEWFCYIEDYVREAQRVLTREPVEGGLPQASAIMRKIAAMAVCAMEHNGAPPRE